MDSYERSVELQRFTRRMNKLTTIFAREHGITAGQVPILYYLHRHSGSIQCDISKRCYVEPATVTSILGTMERDGLIERRADPADRRVWQIFLTQAGEQTYEILQSLNEQICSICFEGMTEEETDTFLSLLDRMSQNIHQKLHEERKQTQ